MRRIVCIALLLALGACSKDKDKDIDAPAKLVNLQATLRVDKVWHADVGGAKVPLRLGLALALDDQRLYAAGRKGDVAAFALASGHQIWRTHTKAPLAGATALGEGLVVVGSSDGDVIALEAATGKERWRVRVNGEVLSAPAIASKAVVLRTVDGKLRGLSLQNGDQLWEQEQAVPRLSLRGVARPTIAGELAVCGFDNGKVVAVNSTDGTIVWESPVAPPHGRTELERLVDIDSAVRIVGQDIFVVGFQSRVGMLALDTGQVWWSHDASSYRALAIDNDVLYMVTADGEISALTAHTGTDLWHQKALLHRSLSAPATSEAAVVFGDYKGYVHWLDKATGALAARVSTGKFRISNPPVAAGNMLYVINDRGRIFAYRVTPIGASAKAVASKRAAQSAVAAPPATATTPAATAPASAAEPTATPAAAAPAPASEPAPTPAAVAPAPSAAPGSDSPPGH